MVKSARSLDPLRKVAGAIAVLGLGLATLAGSPAHAEPSQERTISGSVRAEDSKLEADGYEVTASWADDAVIVGEPAPPEPVTVLADPETGDYVIDGLEPGIYWVRFKPITSGGHPDRALASEYYDDAANLMDANVVNLLSGPAMGIDAELAAQPVYADVSEDPDSSSYSAFYDEITWLAHTGTSRGWHNNDGTSDFRPFSHITRDAMAAFLFRNAGSPHVDLPAESPFVDVTPENTDFYVPIMWLAQEGISEGWTVGETQEFRPFEDVTRDAMAAFLYRYAGVADHDAVLLSPYSDVSTSNPFYGEITWLRENGITNGWDVGTRQEFRPYSPATRDAMAAFLYRLDTVLEAR